MKFIIIILALVFIYHPVQCIELDTIPSQSKENPPDKQKVLVSKKNNTRMIIAGSLAGAGLVLTIVGFATAEEKDRFSTEGNVTTVDVSPEKKFEPNVGIIFGILLLGASILVWPKSG